MHINRLTVITLLCACALLWFHTHAIAQSPESITSEAYLDLVHEATRTLAASNDDQTLVELQSLFAQIEAVTFADGTTVSIKPLLSTAPDTLSRASTLQRLHTVESQLGAMAADRPDMRMQALDSVLERLAVGKPPTLWQQFLTLVGNWLRDNFLNQDQLARMDSYAQGLRVLGWIFALGAGVAVALLLSYWLQGMLGAFVQDARLERRRGDADPLPRTAGEARSNAHDAAHKGDYRQAVRQLYLSALLGLEERGVIRQDRSLTNRELLQTTDQDPALRRSLEPIIDVFDSVWYGVTEPDGATFESYTLEVDRLDRTVVQNQPTEKRVEAS